MAGIGLFTHSGQLVNVVTWFVSLLLVLYLLVYVAKRTNAPLVIGLALVTAAKLALNHQALPFSCHTLTFLTVYTLPLFGGRLNRVFVALVVAMGILTWGQPELLYGLCASVLLAAGGIWRVEAGASRWFARYSYEWFLVHGLCLHLIVRLAGAALWLVLPLATVLALSAAIVLHKGMSLIVKWPRSMSVIDTTGNAPAAGTMATLHT